MLNANLVVGKSKTRKITDQQYPKVKSFHSWFEPFSPEFLALLVCMAIISR